MAVLAKRGISRAKKAVLVVFLIVVVVVAAVLISSLGTAANAPSKIQLQQSNTSASPTSSVTTTQPGGAPTINTQIPTGSPTTLPIAAGTNAPAPDTNDSPRPTDAPSVTTTGVPSAPAPTGANIPVVSPSAAPSGSSAAEVRDSVFTELQLRYPQLNCENAAHLGSVRAVLEGAAAEQDSPRIALGCGSVVATLRFRNVSTASEFAYTAQTLKVVADAAEIVPEVEAMNNVKYVTTDGSPCVFGVIKDSSGVEREIDRCLLVNEGMPFQDAATKSLSEGATWCPTVAVYDVNDFGSRQAWGECKEVSVKVDHPLVRGRKSRSKPHVFIIMVDDMGWNDIGYKNGMSYLTPTLDQLASEGLKLERMYTTPLCGPSRAAFMTGRMPHSTGFGPATAWNRGYSISGKENLLWEVFKGNGYHNIMLGKFGVGGVCDIRFGPLSRGFDNYIGPGTLKFHGYMKTPLASTASLLPLQRVKNREAFQWQYAPFTKEKKSWADSDLNQTYVKPAEEYEKMHLTNVFGIEASNAVSAYAAAGMTKPLLLYLSFRAPHANFFKVPEAPKLTKSTPAQLRKRGNRAEFLRMVRAIDVNVEKVVNAFKAAGFWDDTVVFFVSDNGGLVTRQGGGNNGRLSGGKGLLFEGGIRYVSLQSKLFISRLIGKLVNIKGCQRL